MTKTTQKIAILGMLVAAQVIAGRFISISLPIVTIGFVFLPVSITGILFGPLLGGLSAFLGDLITALLGPYGYFLPMGLSAFLTGAIYSLFLHRKPASIRRIIACVPYRKHSDQCIFTNILADHPYRKSLSCTPPHTDHPKPDHHTRQRYLHMACILPRCPLYAKGFSHPRSRRKYSRRGIFSAADHAPEKPVVRRCDHGIKTIPPGIFPNHPPGHFL